MTLKLLIMSCEGTCVAVLFMSGHKTVYKKNFFQNTAFFHFLNFHKTDVIDFILFKFVLDKNYMHLTESHVLIVYKKIEFFQIIFLKLRLIEIGKLSKTLLLFSKELTKVVYHQFTCIFILQKQSMNGLLVT